MDYKQRNWKIQAKLFKPFNGDCSPLSVLALIPLPILTSQVIGRFDHLNCNLVYFFQSIQRQRHAPSQTIPSPLWL